VQRLRVHGRGRWPGFHLGLRVEPPRARGLRVILERRVIRFRNLENAHPQDIMPQILRQPLISTALDAHGERLSREELRCLFDSLPDEFVINDQHDLTLESVAVARNLQFVQLDSGEWAIVADVEVKDADTLAKRGGFSMAWKAATYTTSPDRAPDIEVLFNPRLFRADLARDICVLSTGEVHVVGCELKQKGLEPEAILIIKFLTIAALSGIVGKIGSNFYEKLLKALRTAKNYLRDASGSEPKIQFIVPRHLNPYHADIFVELSPDQLVHLQVGALSFQDAVNAASVVPHAEQAKKIVVHAVGQPPVWRLTRYEKSSGLQVRISEQRTTAFLTENSQRRCEVGRIRETSSASGIRKHSWVEWAQGAHSTKSMSRSWFDKLTTNGICVTPIAPLLPSLRQRRRLPRNRRINDSVRA
jgi:hypothetical protein